MPEPQAPEKSPADIALEADGGAISPGEMSKTPKPLTFEEMKPVVKEIAKGVTTDLLERKPIPKPVEAATGVLKQGTLPPGGEKPPPPVPYYKLDFFGRVDAQVNFEVNVLNMCYTATHNFVQFQQDRNPLDSADIGQATWGAGTRSPIEQAEPQMAVEVYRQVRLNLREEETSGRNIFRRIWAFVFGQ